MEVLSRRRGNTKLPRPKDSIRGKKWLRRLPSNKPERMQHFLKPPAGTAGTQIVASQLFNEVFVTVDYAMAFFDSGFGRISLAAFATSIESRILWSIVRFARHTSRRFENRISREATVVSSLKRISPPWHSYFSGGAGTSGRRRGSPWKPRISTSSSSRDGPTIVLGMPPCAEPNAPRAVPAKPFSGVCMYV